MYLCLSAAVFLTYMALYIALRHPFPLALRSLKHALLYSYAQAGNMLMRNKLYKPIKRAILTGVNRPNLYLVILINHYPSCSAKFLQKPRLDKPN